MKKLIWLIIIVTVAYYGYNNWLPTNNTQEPSNETEEVIIQPAAWITLKNDSYANYSIQYPGDWKINNSDEQTIFTSPDDLDNVVIALKKNSSTTNNGIQTIKEIAGQQVLIIEGEDPDDGSPAKFIIFNLTNNQKLEARGFGSIFDKMINTLMLNSEQPNINQEATSDKTDKTEDTIEDPSSENKEKIIIEDDEIEIDKLENTIEGEEFIINVFYQKDPGNNCEAVVGLIKNIDTRYNTDEVNALVTLSLGLSSEEISQGYTTSIPTGTRLRNLEIKSGIATADFNAPLNQDGGSCNMSARRAQITATLMQFPDIEQVIITVDGNPETALQP